MSESTPRYELRVQRYGPANTEYEIWQLSAIASPNVKFASRVAAIRGRNLELVEHWVLRGLLQAGVKLGRQSDVKKYNYALPEDIALLFGLLFRTLAPMRSRKNMRAVVQGIESMGREEAAYWFGMSMHRKNPRRVLAALRILLTEPRTKSA